MGRKNARRAISIARVRFSCIMTRQSYELFVQLGVLELLQCRAVFVVIQQSQNMVGCSSVGAKTGVDKLFGSVVMDRYESPVWEVRVNNRHSLPFFVFLSTNLRVE